MDEINILDIETYTENDKVYPFCICLKMYGNVVSFWHSENIVIDFLEHISTNSKTEYIEIYAHNINFDGFIILDGIKTKNIFFDMFIREHSLYWVKIIYLKITIMIRCSYKLIPLSVDTLGKIIGLAKTTFPYKFVTKHNLDYEGEIPDPSYFNSEADYMSFTSQNESFNLKKVTIDYCIRDVNIVHNVLTNILIIINSYSKKNITKNSFSFSSISYKLFSLRYDRFKVSKVKNLTRNHEYIKNSYYGGRCEVFGNPSDGEIIHYFDYKGMYAQCMMEKFPYGPIVSKTTQLNLEEPGFHTIRFKCNSSLPFLPFRGQKLMFPNGEIIGTYWSEEVTNAINYGRCSVLEHYSSLVFDQVDYIFKEFIEEFMSIREKGTYFNIFGKNMINGLYGSFALNDENEMYVVSLNDSEFLSYYSKAEINSFKKIGNAYIINIPKNQHTKKLLDKKNKWDFETKKRNIAYAAIIASKARIKLNKSLDLVTKNNGVLYYTDTDSIFAGFRENNLHRSMGDIKWSDTYEDAVFVSSKFYFLKNEKIKLKGINKNTYAFDEIKKKFYQGEDLEFIDQLSFPKVNYEVFQHFSTKQVKVDDYDKRVFSDDKRKTKPLTINSPD